MDTLSEPAVALLRLHAEKLGRLPVDDDTRIPYRELVAAGLMVPGHSFTDGRESFYAMTEAGMRVARVLGRMAGASAISRD